MRHSTDRILTSHVGSLPAPPDLWTLEKVDEQRLRQSVRDIVQQQRECGVDIVNEGELTKGGSWVEFVNERLTGFVSRPAGASLALLRDSADWHDFSDFYEAAMTGGTLFEQTRSAPDVT